ncbi:DNA polymerase III subunit gamma/tau [bacterium]|nr:DNA polymerase III subunit gamma/tau [bacterium]
MSYIVLARRWRPRQFDDVVGQRPITQTLKNSITSGRIAHAYLFSGPRGVGKTTTARILAKALNCQKGPSPQPCDACAMCEEINKGSSVDVIEIDGASNNSVDDIRDLREKVHYVPARGRYKVYIIDEVHMLSNQAFNALLKTLEEPPKHIVFVLATTEVHKIPLTILSRCQRYDFRRISSQDIRSHLDKLLKQEGDIKGERETPLRMIARFADGSLRDALSLMDQIISLSDGEIKLDQVLDLVSFIDRRTIEGLIRAVSEGKSRDALLIIEGVSDRGYNLKHFVEQSLQYIRDIIIFKLTEGKENALDLGQDERVGIAELANSISQDDLLRYFDMLAKASERMRFSPQPRLIIEMTLIRMAELPKMEPMEDIIRRMNLLGSVKEAASCFPLAPPAGAHASKPLNGEAHEASNVITAKEEGSIFVVDQASEAASPGILSGQLSGEKSSERAKACMDGLDWPGIIKQVKEKGMVFGSVLDHLRVDYKDGSDFIELALKEDNSFYWRLLEDKKNLALLQAAIASSIGKSLEIRLRRPDGKGLENVGNTVEMPERDKIQLSKDIFGDSLALINKEPIIQTAIDIFSAEIVGTHIAANDKTDMHESMNRDENA